MKNSLAGKSLILFAVVVIVNIMLTLLDSMLSGVSFTLQRILILLLLVLPAVAGAIYALQSLLRKEGNTAMAFAGLLLNGLAALFNLMLVLLGG